MAPATQRKSKFQRFIEAINRTQSCWLWTGFINDSGYGVIGEGKSLMLAHRYAWKLAHGSLPAGLMVCHRCDVRNCVNPSHLFIGTNADNMADMVAKGRRASTRGEKNPRAKLTSEQVRAIRLHGGRQVDIAREFGVSQSSVSKIKVGATWA